MKTPQRSSFFFLFDSLLGFGFAAVLAALTADLLRLYLPWQLFVAFGVVLSLILSLAFNFPVPFLLVLAAGSVGFAGGALLSPTFRTAVLGQFAAYAQWIPEPTYDPAPICFTIVLLMFLYLLPILLLLRIRAPGFILLIPGPALCYAMHFFGISFSPILLWLYLLVVLLTLMYLNIPIHRHQRQTARAYAGFMPICIGLVLLASLIPAPKTGFLQNVADKLHENGILVSTPKLATDTTGLDSKLGGKFKPSGVHLLSVWDNTTNNVASPPYLRGSVGVIYDGARWIEASPTPLPPQDPAPLDPPFYPKTVAKGDAATDAVLPAYDAYNHLFTCLVLQSMTDGNYHHFTASSFRNGEISLPFFDYRVQTHNFRTDKFYVPSGTAQLRTDHRLLADGSNSYKSAERTRRSEDYTAVGYGHNEIMQLFVSDFNASSSYLEVQPLDINLASYLSAYYAPDSTYRGMAANLLENARALDDDARTLLARYANEVESIRETYTQLPDTLPQRVRDFALNNFSERGNDFQIAVAIEQYLSTGFPYTTDTSEVPKGEDFVDWFLFREQKGYCTYYATTMTVLCRVLGIPARYVEGFAPGTILPGGEIRYTDEDAHAWCEVYLEGFGWVQFEPTSTYTQTTEPSSAPLPSLKPTPPPASRAPATPRPSRKPIPSTTPTPSPTPTAPSSRNTTPFVFAGLTLLVIGLIVWAFVRARRVSAMLQGNRTFVLPLWFGYTTSLMPPRLPSETREETVARIAALRPEVNWSPLLLLNKAEFSSDTLSPDEQVSLCHLTKELERKRNRFFLFCGKVRWGKRKF